MDPLDESLAELGRGLPFHVDWDGYEKQLLERVRKSKQRERRVIVMALSAGALFGAAATLLISFQILPAMQPRTIAQPNKIPARGETRTETGIQPVTHHVGKSGRITFYGFSNGERPAQAFGAVRRPASNTASKPQ